MNLPFEVIIDTPIEEYRVESFYCKEPETIAWLESFEDGDVLFDVGANIGLYSLYCAWLYPTSQVYAFEPHPANYAKLCRHVEKNRWHDRIHCHRIALDIRRHLGGLHIPNMESGESGAQIIAPVDEDGREFIPSRIYQTIHYDFSGFVKDFDIPNVDHVKIDVDGHEKEILAGMEKYLNRRTIKSLLVDLSPVGIETPH